MSSVARQMLNYKDNYDIAEINVNWSVIDHQQDT